MVDPEAALAADVHEGAASRPASSLVTRNANAVAVVRPSSAIEALAELSDVDFRQRIESMKKGYARIRDIKEAVMRPGVHYGMPGAKTKEEIEKAAKDGRVCIFKPGVEVLLSMFGLVAGDMRAEIEFGDSTNATSPAIRIVGTMQIHRGSLEGPVVAVGSGAWSTWEIKNRYRSGSPKCPDCGREALIHMNEARGGPFRGKPAWWCAPKKDGCGGNFADDDQRIEKTPTKIANPDAHDLLNTGVKVCAKRCRSDGTIIATSSSDLFTQDPEFIPPYRHEKNGQDAADSGNPDDWRTDPSGDEPPATPPPASAQAQGEASKRDTKNDATDKQVKFVASLLGKKGLTVDDLNAKDVGRAFPQDVLLPASIGEFTKAQANAAIKYLDAQPDAPKAGNGAAKPAAPATSKTVAFTADLPDTQANRDEGVALVKQWARALEGATPGRRVLVADEGIWMLVGGNELAHMKARGPIALTDFDVPHLSTLFEYLRGEVERRKADRAKEQTT